MVRLVGRHDEAAIGSGDGSNELLFDVRGWYRTGVGVDGGRGRGLRMVERGVGCVVPGARGIGIA